MVDVSGAVYDSPPKTAYREPTFREVLDLINPVQTVLYGSAEAQISSVREKNKLADDFKVLSLSGISELASSVAWFKTNLETGRAKVAMVDKLGNGGTAMSFMRTETNRKFVDGLQGLPDHVNKPEVLFSVSRLAQEPGFSKDAHLMGMVKVMVDLRRYVKGEDRGKTPDENETMAIMETGLRYLQLRRKNLVGQIPFYERIAAELQKATTEKLLPGQLRQNIENFINNKVR